MRRAIRIGSTIVFACSIGLSAPNAGAAPSHAVTISSSTPSQMARARFERHLTQMRVRARPHVALPRPAAARAAVSVATWAVRVGNTVQIGTDTLPGPEPPNAQSDTTIEPDIAMDPNDPDHLVATYQEGRFRNGASAGIGWAASPDGGRTWADGNMPNLTQAVGGSWERASDPAVVWGPDHVVYIDSLVVSFKAGVTGIAVQRSTDGGRTWSDPVVVQSDPTGQAFNEKTFIAADTFASSPYFGRIYVAWDRADVGGAEPIVLRYSDDHGQTWSGLIQIPGSTGIGALPLVEPNGDLAMVWDDFGTGSDVEVSALSRDGGSTWSPLSTIDTFEGSGPPDMRTGGLPSAAVDPRSGTLYVVWQDARYRSDGTNDVVLSRSSNEGRSWRPLTIVNGDGPDSGIDHFTPAVATWGPSVHVTYRTRAFADGAYSDLVGTGYVRSRDNGTTFGNERQLGPVTDLRWAARAHGKYLGDYMAIAAYGDIAHPVWCAASEPQHKKRWHQTTWSSTISG